MTTKPTLLTADDLLRLYSEGVRGELVQGVLYETMPAGLKHGEIAATLMALLWIHVHPQRLGTGVRFRQRRAAGTKSGYGA